MFPFVSCPRIAVGDSPRLYPTATDLFLIHGISPAPLQSLRPWCFKDQWDDDIVEGQGTQWLQSQSWTRIEVAKPNNRRGTSSIAFATKLMPASDPFLRHLRIFGKRVESCKSALGRIGRSPQLRTAIETDLPENLRHSRFLVLTFGTATNTKPCCVCIAFHKNCFGFFGAITRYG